MGQAARLGLNDYVAMVDEEAYYDWSVGPVPKKRRGEHPPFWRALRRLFAERPEILAAHLDSIDAAHDETVAATLDAIIDAVLSKGCRHRRGTRREVAETVFHLINSDPAVLLSVLAPSKKAR